MSLPLPNQRSVATHQNDYGFSAEQMQACATAARDRFAELCDAAQAVITRWDSPSWKEQPHTAEFIARLRAALEDLK